MSFSFRPFAAWVGLILALACASPNAGPSGKELQREHEVLSLIFGGMAAPARLYRDFNAFLGESLRVFATEGGDVKAIHVFNGPHLIRAIVHASRVESGNDVPYSTGTLRRAREILEGIIDPFFATVPRSRLVLGGHSYGSIVMQCVKTLVEEKYRPERIAAAYALSPVAHRLDADVIVLIGDRDWMVPISDLLSRGRAVRGMPVTVPGLDHFAIQDSPEALAVLREYFRQRANADEAGAVPDPSRGGRSWR